MLDQIKALNSKILQKTEKGFVKHCKLKKGKKAKLLEMIDYNGSLNIGSFGPNSTRKLDNNSLYYEARNQGLNEIRESGFLFAIGHHLENIFERDFSEDAALLEFNGGDLQAIVCDPGDDDLAFDTLITNSNELLKGGTRCRS